MRSETIQKWWPTTQSLDLVEGSVEAVATAVQAEVTRFLKGEAVAAAWEAFPNLDAAFHSAREFANVPTLYLVLPSRSRWSVLWNNSFLCDGYDSLCSCLTKNHGLTTMHWAAHDAWTTFQSGANFHFRRWNGAAVVERFVYAMQEDKRWSFHEHGQPLPEEDRSSYGARLKRDRINEAVVVGLLGRLDARPWSEDFYAIPEQRCFLLRRDLAPETISRRKPSEVLSSG